MSMHVRLAAAEDVKPLLDLIRECLGAEHPAKEVYDPGWVSREMCREGGHETWVVDAGPRLDACISFLRPDVAVNPIANLGRNLFRPGTFESGNAQALLEQVRILCAERSELGILRVPASETQQQRLLEGSGCPAVGYQPMKHTRPTREGTLFYMIPEHTVLQRRLPVGELPPQTHALACEVLSSLGLPDPGPVREGITGLPAHPPVHCFDSTLEAYQAWCATQPAVPADLRLLNSAELQTIEGELTGESAGVEKCADAIVSEDAPVGDRVNMVFSGTTVVNGEARGVVVATGRPSTRSKRPSRVLVAPRSPASNMAGL